MSLSNLLVFLKQEIEFPHLQMKLEAPSPHPQKNWKKGDVFNWENYFSNTQKTLLSSDSARPSTSSTNAEKLSENFMIAH